MHLPSNCFKFTTYVFHTTNVFVVFFPQLGGFQIQALLVIITVTVTVITGRR